MSAGVIAQRLRRRRAAHEMSTIAASNTPPDTAARPGSNAPASPSSPIEPVDPIDAMEPEEPTEHMEPEDPIDKIEPTKAIDRIAPADPIAKIDPVDAIEQLLRIESTELRDQIGVVASDVIAASRLSVVGVRSEPASCRSTRHQCRSLTFAI